MKEEYEIERDIIFAKENKQRLKVLRLKIKLWRKKWIRRKLKK